MPKCILVKLDIFSKIGLGHFSRINNLAEADLENEYFLIYRTDIDVKELLKKSSFRDYFNIGSKESNLKWDNLNKHSIINITDYKNDIFFIDRLIKHVENSYGVVHSLIVDNYLVKQEWFNLISENSRINYLNLIYIDDFNSNLNNINLSIFYPSDKNSLVKESNNKLIAEGLKFTPFSLDLVNKRVELFTKNSFQKENNNILISFGFFDEINLSIKAIKEILIKTNYHILVIVSREAKIYKNLCHEYSCNNRVKIFDYVSDISSIYIKSKTSVGTFGLMSLEKAYLAVPQLNILEETNQENIKNALIKHEFANSFENISKLFNTYTSSFLFPEKSLYQNLAIKSKRLFGEGILEWVRLIKRISS